MQCCKAIACLLALVLGVLVQGAACRKQLSLMGPSTARQLQQQRDATATGGPVQPQPVNNGSSSSNSSEGSPDLAPGPGTGLIEPECLQDPGSVNCTGLPSPGADLPPSLNKTDNSTNGGSSTNTDPSATSNATSADSAPEMVIALSPVPESQALPQPGGLPDFGRAYSPPGRHSAAPKVPSVIPAPAPAPTPTPSMDSGAKAGQEQGQAPAAEGPGGEGGALPQWALAVVVAAAASLVALAGVAGFYGVKKHRNRHKQFQRYVSAHLSRHSSNGSGELLKLSGVFRGGSSGFGGSSVASGGGGACSQVQIELGTLGGKHSTGSHGSAASAHGEFAAAAPLPSHQLPSQQHAAPACIPAAYPSPAAVAAWQQQQQQGPLRWDSAGDAPSISAAAQHAQHGGVVDEATPMDAEDAEEASPGSSAGLFFNPLLLSQQHRLATTSSSLSLPAAAAAALGSPPAPETPSYCPVEPEGLGLGEAEPMELESLEGAVVALNPWAALLPQQGQQAQQQPLTPQAQQDWFAAAADGAGTGLGSASSEQQPPPPQQQQQGWVSVLGPTAAPTPAGGPAGAESGLLWARFWDAVSKAGGAPAPGALPTQRAQHADRRSALLSHASSGPESDATSPLRPALPAAAAGPAGRAGSSGGGGGSPAGKDRACGGGGGGGSGSGSGSGGGNGSGPAATARLPSALGEGDWQIDPDEIQICKRVDGSDWQLGAGAFGKVYKALRGGVSEVAVKVLLADASDDEEFQREVAILRSCRDVNVVQFLGACLQPGRTMLVTEYLAGGDLRGALSRHPGTFRWGAGGRGRALALDVARGLHYLHSRRIIHFDLKSNNILLSRDGTLAKIADVGLAAVVSQKYVSIAGLRGAFAWAAPEVLTGERHCSEKVDCYSLGVVLWELVTGEVPQRGRMREPRVPEECPPEIASLIDRCLSVDPSTRPSAKEVFLAIQASPKTLPPAAKG